MSGLSKKVKIIIAAAVSVLILVAGYKQKTAYRKIKNRIKSGRMRQQSLKLLIRGNQKARSLHSMNLLLPIMEAVQLMNGR